MKKNYKIMKENYTPPAIEVVLIEVEDTLCSSTQLEDMQDNGTHGDW